MTRITLVAAVLVASTASAQTARPGVDCSLLSAAQAQGLTCATAPRAPEPSAADCDPKPDAYTEPARALRCAIWWRSENPPPPLPTYLVSHTYVHPYPHIRMVVLGIAMSIEGVPVVTAQYIAGERVGEVFAFRVDQGAPWALEGGQ